LKTKVDQASITHLVSHNEHVLLSFELHYHRFQSSDNVTVRFAPCSMILPVKLRHLSPKAVKRTAIPIIKLVIISIGKVFWVRQLHVRGAGGDKTLHYTRHVKSVKKYQKISYLDFLIRHPITNTRIEFIQ
jgi:hypothetical protein